MIRYCTKNGIHVLGGAERLFKYFIRKYSPQSIITYSDISKFKGNIYLKLDFKPIQTNPIIEPNYVWVTNNNIVSRYKTQKHKLLEQGLGTEEQTEDEIMTRIGYMKINDSGNIKLEWREWYAKSKEK